MMSFAASFCLAWTRKFYLNGVIVREKEDGVELVRHNGASGLAYREIGEPLVVSRDATWRYDPEAWCRRTARRIDAWAKGEPDPDGPDEWYAAEVARMAERAPA